MYDPDAVGDYIEAHGERIVSSERLGYLPQELSKEDKKKTVYEFFSESEMFYLKTPGELAQLSAEMQIDKDWKMEAVAWGWGKKTHAGAMDSFFVVDFVGKGVYFQVL